MNSTIHEPLDLTSEEFAILAELLESECAKLPIEIRTVRRRSRSARSAETFSRNRRALRPQR